MNSENILRDALNLSPAERLYVIEILSKSLSEPDEKIDIYWKEEVEKRYNAFLTGKIKGIPYEDIIKNED